MKTMNFKRVIISLVTVGSFFVSTFAQESKKQECQRPTVEERAKKQTERMKEKLGLTEDQAKTVYDINLKYAKEDEKKFSKKEQERQKRMEEFKISQAQKDAELKKVLNAEQYDKFQKQKGEMKKKKAKKGKGQSKEKTSEK